MINSRDVNCRLKNIRAWSISAFFTWTARVDSSITARDKKGALEELKNLETRWADMGK
ncbi:MAG: hypothetical protein WC364_02930 [Eubacteriales bacterium]